MGEVGEGRGRMRTGAWEVAPATRHVLARHACWDAQMSRAPTRHLVWGPYPLHWRARQHLRLKLLVLQHLRRAGGWRRPLGGWLMPWSAGTGFHSTGRVPRPPPTLRCLLAFRCWAQQLNLPTRLHSKVSGRVPRCNAVGAHAVLGPLARQVLRQLVQRRLCHRVDAAWPADTQQQVRPGARGRGQPGCLPGLGACAVTREGCTPASATTARDAALHPQSLQGWVSGAHHKPGLRLHPLSQHAPQSRGAACHRGVEEHHTPTGRG